MILNDGYFIEGNNAKVIRYGSLKEGRIVIYRKYQDNLKDILELENIIETLKFYKELLLDKNKWCNKLVMYSNLDIENTYTYKYINKALSYYEEVLLKLEKDNKCSLNNNTNYIKINQIDSISYSAYLRILLKACYIIDEYPSYWEGLYKRNKVLNECLKRRYNEDLIKMIIKVLEENVTLRKIDLSILTKRRKKCKGV